MDAAEASTKAWHLPSTNINILLIAGVAKYQAKAASVIHGIPMYTWYMFTHRIRQKSEWWQRRKPPVGRHLRG